jgi:hypothetical protein
MAQLFAEFPGVWHVFVAVLSMDFCGLFFTGNW